jgi:hypothetical protein
MTNRITTRANRNFAITRIKSDMKREDKIIKNRGRGIYEAESEATTLAINKINI